MLRRAAWFTASIFTVLATVFAVQNAALVEYVVFFQVVEIRRSVVVGSCLIIGFFIGWLFGASRRFKR